ncbi:hypothetical protein H310_07515 [Aphanomyces invadans]|uniref:Carboxypeptidase n=1 Tax=Aphanomyces invadans TaxID=157072 RepID=A0A024U1J6_9STRA|nr:hypothetical protein H310_07515 [Aphanomyces invadans]ETW00090.1 hypothetical protein H310_07515 [Aphanomyces invadans]|eukprot:XP_008871115.1 hypothetical protein H310_07515 [Aphanomyces invadans]
MAATEHTHLLQHPARGKASPWRFILLVAGAAVGGIAVAVFYSIQSSVTTILHATPSGVNKSYCDPSVHHEFGYIKLPHKVNDHYFYSFFESRNDPANDPLVLWLEGGPGSSSTWTLFNMNGPCFIGDDLNSTVPNPHSWTNHANVIWLDQPTGVGFSYGDAQDDDQTEDDVGRNVFEFLRGWLKAHPSYASRPFFVTGQSYGGHYVPAVAHYIVTHQVDLIGINLHGIVIGNGWMDATIQCPTAVDMVASVANQYNISLVSDAEMVQMKQNVELVDAACRACDATHDERTCKTVLAMWEGKLVQPMVTNPPRSVYDVREVCAPICNDHGMAKTGLYLNMPSIQAQLGVKKPYTWNNGTVAMEFSADTAMSVTHFFPPILASGVRVLLYAGDADLMCNWIGIEVWTRALEWPGHAAYNAAPVNDLIVGGEKAGHVQSAANLTFVRVFNSGHGVPVDQPVVGLALIDRFFQNLNVDDAQEKQVEQ